LAKSAIQWRRGAVGSEEEGAVTCLDIRISWAQNADGAAHCKVPICDESAAAEAHPAVTQDSDLAAPLVERGQGLTLWRQIDEALSREIAAGTWPAGTKLPSEQELAMRFGVNRHTIRRAIQALVQRGLVRVEQGRGIFVPEGVIDYLVGRRTRFSENILRNRRYPSTALLCCDEVTPTPTIAGELALRLEDQVIRLDRISLADAVPVSLATIYLPAARFPGFASIYREHPSITATLRHFGIGDYVRSRTRVTARLPSPEEALHLKQPQSRPVLQAEALDLDLAGRPIAVNITRFAGDRVQITFDAGVPDDVDP
jgi:GntR family transcriptional regulator, phosphonate transport system regulatory protein